MSGPVSQNPWIVWRLTDGKAGHEAQSAGLVAALKRLHPVDEHVLKPKGPLWRDLLTRRFAAGSGLPGPDLLIGAGHGTHLALIAARRARGGRSIVLMKPSLPVSLFDLCIVPEHDGARPAANMLITKGVLNPVRPHGASSPERGLILIGGPSKHFGWSDADMAAQVARIAAATPSTDWLLTTSRRTPTGFADHISRLDAPNLVVVPVDETPQGWVAEQMAAAGQIWVSEDSASMIYEALSSGAGVGLLSCPEGRPTRITRGVRDLRGKGLVTAFADWNPGDPLPPPRDRFAEADRCARWIAEYFFEAGS